MLIGAMLGVSIATGEMVNESHVPVGKSGVMTSSARELKEVPNREIVQGRKLKEVPKWQMDSTEYLYFKDPVGDAGGRTGGRFTSLDKCTRYHPLFGPESKYDFTDPSCSWMQGDRVSKACQYFATIRINTAYPASTRHCGRLRRGARQLSGGDGVGMPTIAPEKRYRVLRTMRKWPFLLGGCLRSAVVPSPRPESLSKRFATKVRIRVLPLLTLQTPASMGISAIPSAHTKTRSSWATR